ncbi:Putative bifunctional UDP-N-acetylglucosamine transferase and deubiquitinase ALG13, partial [Geodia barretti]
MTEEGRSVLVTVGTTSFDELVGSIAEENFMKELVAKGYTRLVLQIGKGDEARVPQSIAGLTVDHYSLKPSIKIDMQQASLIISHG